METKLVRARAALAGTAHGDAMLVSSGDNVRWLTGFSGSFGFVVLSESRAVFVTDSRYAIQAQEEVEGFEIESFGSPTTGKQALADLVHRLGLGSLGFEAASLSYKTVEEYRAALNDDGHAVEMVPVGDAVSDLRMVKSEDEIAKIRRACALADAAFAHVQRLFQVGVVEYDLQLELEFYLRRHRAGLAFDPIVVSGENSARPHGSATEKALAPGDFLTLDFGATLDGYHSDLTRTVVIGEPTERHREVYGQVLKAQLAALDRMRPGAKAHDVDALSREILDERGLAKYFGHSLGHGLGTVVHDVGRLGTNSPHVLAEGQVWTVEPGVYIPGFGGVRIEDDVVIREGGVELLTHSPKDLLIFGA